MRIFFVILFLCICCKHLAAQQQFFVYIQSEQQQPFYSRLNDKLLSSTESGYLIIPKLDDRNYDLIIGFPKNQQPEQRFQVSINKKDKGFQLKNFAERGWGLVNLENQAIIMNSGTGNSGMETQGVKKTDAFSVMLSTAVNDSAILYPQISPESTASNLPAPSTSTVGIVEANENPKNENTNTAAVTATQNIGDIKKNSEKDSVSQPLKEIVVSDKKPETAPDSSKGVGEQPGKLIAIAEKKPERDRPFISRLSQEQTPTMYKATYLEQYNYSTDTINIIIPKEPVEIAKPITASATHNGEVPPRGTDTKPVETSINTPEAVAVGRDTSARKKSNIVIMNSDCKAIASENDVDKLRVRMLGEKTFDEKLAAARKIYKNKCFSVKQVRALTEVFTTEESKYRFLDLSYAFTSDSGNYYLLEEALQDDYYKNRFRAMIHK